MKSPVVERDTNKATFNPIPKINTNSEVHVVFFGDAQTLQYGRGSIDIYKCKGLVSQFLHERNERFGLNNPKPKAI
jgi:hypothetical protein